jgi:hypothetical protein
MEMEGDGGRWRKMQEMKRRKEGGRAGERLSDKEE